ncbi:molybdate ABC transporter permease subunit [Pyxidicoccus sp. 3LFB2]
MEGTAELVLFTVTVAAVATLLILPLGVAVAYALARWDGPGKGVVETVLALPMVLPPTAVGLVLLELLARNGPLGRVLDSWGVEVVFTPKAVVLASAVMAFPLLVRSARSGFEEVDPRLVAVARTLGDTRVRAFFRVTLPLAWRGVLVGALLAFSRALGDVRRDGAGGGQHPRAHADAVAGHLPPHAVGGGRTGAATGRSGGAAGVRGGVRDGGGDTAAGTAGARVKGGRLMAADRAGCFTCAAAGRTRGCRLHPVACLRGLGWGHSQRVSGWRWA